MLGLMRKHATSWLIKVALFAIVVVFIFWGGYSYTERKASRVAVVNGSYIGMQEYQSAYDNLVEQMRRQFGNQFSSELVETLRLKEQALNRLINRRILSEEARLLNLEITREELQNAILAYPAFQINGRFDPQRYQQTLRYLRLTPQEFEANQLEDLLIGKVERLITRSAKVLDAELVSFFHHTQDKVNLAYVQIDPQRFVDQAKGDETALNRYFDERQETYRFDAKRSIVYVRFASGDFLAEVDPTGAQAEEYYRLHQEDYKEPEKVRARHILFKTGQQSKPSNLQAVQKKAQEVLSLARKGDDFADLARKYSEDSTASKGGDLGYFTRADMVKPFAEAAFSLGKGEISDLVRTRFGLHIIKVEDFQEGRTKPFAEVQEAVIKSLKQELARETARQRAESFAEKSRALDDLKRAAEEQGLHATESGFFSAGEAIPSLGRQPDLNEVVFSLQPKEVSPAVSVGNNYIVAQLAEIQDARLPDFEEVKEQVRKDWSAEQSKTLARKQAQEWLEAARKQGSLAEVARRNGLDMKETGLFTSFSQVPALGNQRDLVVTAFALTPERPLAPEVYEVNGKFLIFELRARQPAPEERFKKEKDGLARRLLQMKKQQAFERWLAARRQQSDIRILQEL